MTRNILCGTICALWTWPSQSPHIPLALSLTLILYSSVLGSSLPCSWLLTANPSLFLDSFIPSVKKIVRKPSERHLGLATRSSMWHSSHGTERHRRHIADKAPCYPGLAMSVDDPVLVHYLVSYYSQANGLWGDPQIDHKTSWLPWSVSVTIFLCGDKNLSFPFSPFDCLVV